MINRALKTIRLYHSIKQSELADVFNISKSYLSEIESGKKTPNLELLDKYSSKFEIPVSSLIFLSEEIRSPSKKSVAENFRLVFIDKVLKIMEWSIDRNEGKEAKNKNQ